ncbi:TPA: hypothetical protein RJR39_000814 [Burkholderia cenocepacia]|uniref:hypothetical protein n=1 Tax=Burkholderia cenocepacia TaxID=95486 RepID=UPI001BA007F9|nr:hypothetical protein [Burkholderia cenocepacia]MBR8198878.1 hypothetical protein [Burkholderia cenocepacia]HDV6324777.1 hypothetical protein [Burkholderia cenocepacia]HDV6350818.1 hypothetical protein [Burkholderia cenocepacia]
MKRALLSGGSQRIPYDRKMGRSQRTETLYGVPDDTLESDLASMKSLFPEPIDTKTVRVGQRPIFLPMQ